MSDDGSKKDEGFGRDDEGADDGDEAGFEPGFDAEHDETSFDPFADEKDDADEPTGSPFPTFTVDLVAPKVGVQGFLRALVFGSVFSGAIALLSFEHGERGLFEVTGLFSLVAGALVLPTRAVASRLARYPERGRVRFDRHGFRLPWLGAESPGPEGPWESLRGFRVRERKGSPRLLILDFAAGRFALSDTSLGARAFDAAITVLERALGPGGVLLGTLVRLPVHPPDERPFLERKMTVLRTCGIALAFMTCAVLASNIAVRIAAALFASLAVLATGIGQAWDQAPGADLVLGLDGLVLPLPRDLRCSVKLPLSAFRRGLIARANRNEAWLVIEHEGGSIRYPLSWLDPRKAGEFARQLERARR